MDSLVRLDTRGRLVIPNEFRESLDLKEGDNVLLSLDQKTNTITICPIYGSQNDLVSISIEFGDMPGALAVIASRFAELNMDLLMTESKSSQRGKKARWNIVSDISKVKLGIDDIRKSIESLAEVESMSIKMMSRGLVHS